MSASDDRWEHGMNGWRVLLFSDRGLDEAVGYGEVTGYDALRQSFYVVLDNDPSGEPEYASWERVRPA